jgi:hypothetical protein
MKMLSFLWIKSKTCIYTIFTFKFVWSGYQTKAQWALDEVLSGM